MDEVDALEEEVEDQDEDEAFDFEVLVVLVVEEDHVVVDGGGVQVEVGVFEVVL